MRYRTVGYFLGGSLALLLFGLGQTSLVAAPSGCQDACFRAKSSAYERCRRIAPAERAARMKCFKEADQSLQGCLATCQAPRRR